MLRSNAYHKGHGLLPHLGILMAKAQIADHLIGYTVCGVSSQVKVKFNCLWCACKPMLGLLRSKATEQSFKSSIAYLWLKLTFCSTLEALCLAE